MRVIFAPRLSTLESFDRARRVKVWLGLAECANFGSNLFDFVALQNLRRCAAPVPPAFCRQGDNSGAEDDDRRWKNVPREYYRQGARRGRGGAL